MIKVNVKKISLIFILQLILIPLHINVHSRENDFLKVDVQPLSFIDHKMVKLGDIAHITGKNDRIIKSAKSIVLSRSPVLNRSIFLGKDLIEKAILKNGFDLKEIKLIFPQKIIVKNKITIISEDEVKKTLREYIYKNMPWRKDQVEITQIGFKGDISLPGGKIVQKITSKGNSSFLGKVPLYLEFLSDGKILKRKKVNIEIRVLMPLVLARAFMKKNQIISENDIYIEERWVSKISRNFYTSKEEVLGKKLKRAIKAGQPLFEQILVIPADIARGNKVTILVETRNLRITAPGIAREEGRKGQIIKVKNLDSNKIIYAKVRDNTTVQIDF